MIWNVSRFVVDSVVGVPSLLDVIIRWKSSAVVVVVFWTVVVNFSSSYSRSISFFFLCTFSVVNFGAVFINEFLGEFWSMLLFYNVGNICAVFCNRCKLRSVHTEIQLRLKNTDNKICTALIIFWKKKKFFPFFLTVILVIKYYVKKCLLFHCCTFWF